MLNENPVCPWAKDTEHPDSSDLIFAALALATEVRDLTRSLKMYELSESDLNTIITKLIEVKLIINPTIPLS